MRNPMIDLYVERYYDRWLKYTRWFCSYLGIYPEAYDILTDTLVEILSREDLALMDLIAGDQTEGLKFYNYVRKALKFKVLKTIYRGNVKRVKSIDDTGFNTVILQTEQPSEDTLLPDALYNDMREIEAQLREDCFVTSAVCVASESYSNPEITLQVYRNTPRAVLRKSGILAPKITYAVDIYSKKRTKRKMVRKYFSNKGLAMCWALQNRSIITPDNISSLCKQPAILIAE